MIIPHLTTCYNDIIDPNEDNSELIPPKSCVIDYYFLYRIEHCLYLGKNFLNLYFGDLKITKDFLKGKKYIFDQNLSLILQIKKILNLLLEQKIDKIIEFAIMEYTKHFDYQINNYLFLKEK